MSTMAREFKLHWETFSNYTREIFNDLSSSGDFADVTLICDDQRQIEAHRIVLSACSEVFRNILKANSHKTPSIYLRGILHRDLETVLEFLYQGEVTLEQERLTEFLSVAKDLRIDIISRCFDDSNQAIANSGHTITMTEEEAKEEIKEFNDDEHPQKIALNEGGVEYVAHKEVLDEMESIPLEKVDTKGQVDDSLDISGNCPLEESVTEQFEHAAKVVKRERGRPHEEFQFEWRTIEEFKNKGQFYVSIIHQDLKANYIKKKKAGPNKYAQVEYLDCKYSYKAHYLRCKKRMKVIYPHDSTEVIVQENVNEHEHKVNPLNPPKPKASKPTVYETDEGRVNEKGFKVRGPDHIWTKLAHFENPSAFQESSICHDLNDNFTMRRKHDMNYGEVRNYFCKFVAKTHFLPCKKQIRVVFPADSLEVQ